MTKRFTLGKKERLKSRKQTELVFSEGKRFTILPLRVHYTIQPAAEPLLQAGVGVSSKSFKKSVDRNRIKRQLREAYRLQKLSLQETIQKQNSQLHIFFIYTGKELPVYATLYEKMGKCIDKFSELISAST